MPNSVVLLPLDLYLIHPFEIWGITVSGEDFPVNVFAPHHHPYIQGRAAVFSLPSRRFFALFLAPTKCVIHPRKLKVIGRRRQSSSWRDTVCFVWWCPKILLLLFLSLWLVWYHDGLSVCLSIEIYKGGGSSCCCSICPVGMELLGHCFLHTGGRKVERSGN